MRSLFENVGAQTTGLLLVIVCLAIALATGCATGEPAQTGTTPPVATEPATPGAEVETDTGAVPPSDQLPEGATLSVAEVISYPTQDQRVVLAGEITEMSGAEDFMLSDGTGEVFVDGDNDFGKLAVGDRLLVTGTVDIEDSPARVEIQATAVERR